MGDEPKPTYQKLETKKLSKEDLQQTKKPSKEDIEKFKTLKESHCEIFYQKVVPKPLSKEDIQHIKTINALCLRPDPIPEKKPPATTPKMMTIEEHRKSFQKEIE